MMQITLPEHLPMTAWRRAPAGRRPRLLIVDDQPVNIQALHRVFSADCQVLMATDGAAARCSCAASDSPTSCCWTCRCLAWMVTSCVRS